ncbi:glycoside hydrolase family 70 protein, partial [Leuconostoc suionicum]|uniref:glycoside hydrolase family 70 protein n=1 Tax=Leuconostoc suionicum TaxID=1511761 RepID=UPI003C31774C
MRNRNVTSVFRKKMYKSGKMLVIAGSVSIIGVTSFIQQAQADVSQNNGVVVTTAVDQSNAGATDKSITTNDKAATTADTSTNDKATTTADTPTNNKATTTADTSTNNKAATTADTSTNNKATTTADTSDNNNAATTSDKDVSSSAQKSQTNDNNSNTTDTTAALEASSKNLKTIDGKTYYYDDDGQIKKNFATVIDGKVLYFDKDTGALADTNDYQFLEGLTSENNNYTEHNASVGTSSDSYTNVDGYLTADSWYRPKDILVNGQNWESSKDDDLRPLLMTWWPDKATQVNYLNAMKYLDTTETETVYTSDDSQEALNKAAQNIQVKIEEKISQEGQTQWLKDDISKFVDSQSNWNIASESKGTDHLQGGALLYVNSDKTPDANSDYRLLNRTPTNQTGTPLYT